MVQALPLLENIDIKGIILNFTPLNMLHFVREKNTSHRRQLENERTACRVLHGGLAV
jgi:hypothetical protein